MNCIISGRLSNIIVIATGKMNQPEIVFKEILTSQYFAVLSTVSGRLPYNNLVSYAVTSDLKSVIFITDRTTRKFKNIQGNRNISLLIDNRTNKPSDISNASAITIIGTAHESTEGISNLQTVFLARHPNLHQFVKNPDNAVIVVDIIEYIVAGFKKTQRVVIT